MIRERNVPKAVLFKLIKSRKPFGLMGLIFTSLSLFIFLPLVLFIMVTVTEPYEKYDFDVIDRSGTAAQATVTSVEPITNVSVNGQHPVVIKYTYTNGGNSASDKFQTFDLEKAGDLKPGDIVAIKTYNGESAIVGMEPYSLPFYLFLMIPLTFLMVGLVFLLIALLPALKKYKLYKTGAVKDGEIISMAPHGLGLRGLHQPSLVVTYFFTGRAGTKIFAESVTDEYSLLHEKKSGDTVKIFVDIEDESKSCLVPKLESLKYNWNI